MPKLLGFDESVIKRATCRNCGAINGYRPNEVVTLWSGKDYSGGPDGAEGFKCVVCDENVITRRW